MKWRFITLFLLATGIASADERILSYHSDILIRADGWIEVTETIRVRAEGNQIRRGIYRDYPTQYEDRFGNDVEVLYEPRSVTRNGQPEDFNSESYRNGVRTYFGRSDRLLQPGEHTYAYRYDAGRMLGFFEDYDELYWNVTGNDSDFPIDSASATVSFAFEVSADTLRQAGYTGLYGATGSAYRSFIGAGSTVRFETTSPLGPHEALTIAVGFPTGMVAEPSQLQRFIWLLSDNLNLLVALAGLAAMLGYYIPVWQNYGKDPEPGVVFTRYEPPEGFSPASLRYIENMGYDNATMTTGVVSLAVKGYLRIESDDDEHSLHKLDPGADAPPLSTGEQELYEELFDRQTSVTLTDENHEIIGGAKDAHERSLKFDYHKKYFITNGLLNLPPLLIGIFSALAAFLVGPSFFVIVVVGLMLVTLIAFAIILKRPTSLGRSLLDESAGFTDYLEYAEKDDLNLRNPPEKTPQLFEQYLPFALALGVEQQWAEQFNRIFASLSGPNGGAWQPTWYSGSWNNLDLSSNTSSLSSNLGSAISSSVTPPGSSSGSSGGGFSGGGGGGGGVGGW
ncbi:MAG: DUF2207 domain-containing protein [Gammaproteobacteria bacterium]|nr:DUF2207 domain-containing protein [Gammaproteobacteria bacterium]